LDKNRTDALQKKINDTQEWVDFAGTDRWEKLKNRILNEVVNPAKEAFHKTEIDLLTDEKVLRGFLGQRATVKVGLKIIGLVEGSILENLQAKKELEEIEKHKKEN